MPNHPNRSKRTGSAVAAPIDPRDPDPTREGIFRNHNCYRCQSGKLACVRGDPRHCEYPHARND